MSGDTYLAGKELVIYLPDLSGGGAERLHVGLAPHFLAAGMQVTFLLHRRRGELLDAIPSGARVISLDVTRPAAALLPLIGFLRQERPAFLISNTEHMNIIALWAVSLAFARSCVIVTQHNALSQQAKRPSLQYRAVPLLYRLSLRKADAIVAVSQGVATEVEKICGLTNGSVRVIHNGLIDDSFEARAAEPIAHRWFGESSVLVAVGRMVEQKDHATLIRALAIVNRSRDVRLIILGEGPLRAELGRLAASLGLADLVDMPGFVANPLPFMRQAAALVLSSRFEGFGNVLVEALACGTQVVSTDCTFGPSEILANGKFGRLAPVGDVEALAQAILAALADPIDTRLLQSRGMEFATGLCAEKYLALCGELSQKPIRKDRHA
ncbi:MAG TPA: glycosyltransferase [Methylovirgula sp.]|nr:glycosyltransferase [Methylovirgula sp.]